MDPISIGMSLLGTIGLIGEIFDGCIKGYRVFSAASNLGRDSERLVCKIKIEEMRLWVWGREWGIHEGKFEANLLTGSWGNEGLKALAAEILTQLLETIVDCNKLKNRYGLREEAPGSVDIEAYKKISDVKALKSGRVRTEMKLRARWVIADKERFEELLGELQYFNDRLEKLFPPGRIATLQRTWTNELLQTAKHDTGNLTLLQSASSGVYPGLNALAQLKQLRINLDAKEPSNKVLSSSELKIAASRIHVEKDSSSQRSVAVYKKPLDYMRGDEVSKDVNVLIDWIPYDKDMDMDSRLHLYQRVDNLARLLHSNPARHPDLYTLDCAGYVDDAAKSRYGIIHIMPSTITDFKSSTLLSPTSSPPSLPFRTLASLIDDSTRTPDLDVRFKLAHTLAIALWSFHSLDWLHKSYSAHNILFFNSDSPANQNGTITPNSTNGNAATNGSAAEKHSLQNPYVVGFDSSRPDGLDEMTCDPKMGNSSRDIYRHPDSLGVWRQPYRKSFDVYSFGLVLLEIGMWKGIRHLHKPKYTPSVFRDKVLAGLVPALGSKTGRIFRTTVERCLVYDEMKEGESMKPHQFMEWLVYNLEGLKV